MLFSSVSLTNFFKHYGILHLFLMFQMFLLHKLLLNMFIKLNTSLRIIRKIMNSHFCIELNMPEKLKLVYNY